MFDTVSEFTNRLLGLDLGPEELGFGQMAWRAFVVFTVAVVLVRFASGRLIGRTAGFDIVVAVVLGSVLSRGVTGQSAFFPTLGAAAVLVLIHTLVATLAFHSHWFSQLVKGRPRLLISGGAPQPAELRRCKITPEDLDENLRLQGHICAVKQVAEARLERNGVISVVPASREE
jgi:uncharacterized membrane protein YcaP (DUF421 family)